MILKNVKITFNGATKAYAAQAKWDKTLGTITLFDGVNNYGVVTNTNYVMDSKDLRDPVAVKYSGPNQTGALIFLVLES